MNRHRAGKTIAAWFGLVGLLVLACPGPAAGQPTIKFKDEAWDFGKVKQGTVLAHEFVFTNVGNSSLVIRNVATTCGCTAALASADKIAPGKEGKIEVKFDTRGYGGPVSKVVFVDSNDPAQPRQQLKVSADIETPPSPRIELEPYNYDAGLLVEGGDIKAKLKIMNKGEQELRVEFNHRNAAFSVGGKPAPSPLKIPAGKEADVEITIPTLSRTGVVREYVLVKSNDPMRSTLSLYISGYIITKEQLKELFNKYKDILR
jgi:hypothetical protein